ncbi:nucleotidyltransferase family protein [Hydrogenophaga sp.]|uniref:nucleotidyltransferase domain-containing protein n=1 Tax=Hydrogenophaga sp. TaxID=1904254 RepID=UPI00272F878A|nr:nucleotidyltransferase family protein [Hydrogenophaga sp.]MDP1684498.1 nucleotidyltransferase family protein [Hydrogenophaga sp.]
MSTRSVAVLLAALHRPASMADLSLAQWDVLIRQGRRADLLARIGENARLHGVWDSTPAQPRRHLESAMKLATRQHLELHHEVQAISRALQPLGEPAVLLKGAAYTLAGLAAARGRMVSDVDILVPRHRLTEVESALMMAGWVQTNRDAYDQQYYRKWMHELPPLRHVKRGSVLDVHHAILPPTARLKPDSALLLVDTVAAGEDERIRVLGKPDMVLHSAAHLFHEGELEMGLRGLVDLDALLREFGQEESFWPALQARAQVLDLEGPLHQALRYTRLLMQTPAPDGMEAELGLAARRRGAVMRPGLQDALFLRALLPDHATASDRWTPLARWFLYLRGHWLRMPPALLAWHLMRKLFKSLQPERSIP